MSDKPKPQDAPERPDAGQAGQAGGKPASDRDEAPPGTPGTGENIDPKTGETFTEGIGGA